MDPGVVWILGGGMVRTRGKRGDPGGEVVQILGRGMISQGKCT